MTETARTLTYVGVAAASLVVAWFATPPVDITPEQLVQARLGQELFPEFKNPTDPTSIRVVSFDEARAEPRIFAVEFKDGLWTIPSHHNYPADGATMLAKTAASSIGIKRDEFRSSSKEDHEELGVVDPLDADASRLKGRGQRITLSKGESGLVDLIIGKQVRDRPGFYYVRLPGEDSTYVAKIDINLSTKFSEWVETDLLKVSRDALTEIEIDNYSISVEGGRAKIVPGEISKLDRAKPADPWKLDGLDEKAEEVDTAKVNDLVSTLDELKLVGVRPKPKGINADLTIDREYVQNPLQRDILLADMHDRGFEVGPSRDDETKPHLYSRQGELSVATNDGVVYVLRFGEIFSGDEADIETGIEADKKKAEAAKDDKDGEKKDEKEAGAGKQSSRYLFVTTSFDEKFLGEKPIEPERPAGLPEEPAKKPAKKGATKSKAAPKIKPGRKSSGAATKKPAAEEEEPSDSKEGDGKEGDKVEESSDEGDGKDKKKVEECGPPSIADDEKKDETPSDAKPDDEKKDDEKQDGEKKDAEKKDPPADKASDADAAKPDEKPAAVADDKPKEKSPEQLKRDYETLKQKYDADLKAYEDKLKAGQEKIEELNRRFGAWYYVISAESFSKLHLSRKELVKEKGAAADAKSKPGDPSKDEQPGEADAADKPQSDPPEESSDKPAADDDKPEAKSEKDEQP